MSRRGQFYLISAIVIVSLLVSFAAVFNYSKKEENIIVNDLSKSLTIESQKVLEYGTAHENVVRQFGEDYSFYVGSDIQFYFITGTNPNINAYEYVNGIETDASDSLTIDNQNNKIIFTIDESYYEFPLTSAENFYYIISQQIKGETYVATG